MDCHAIPHLVPLLGDSENRIVVSVLEILVLQAEARGSVVFDDGVGCNYVLTVLLALVDSDMVCVPL